MFADAIEEVGGYTRPIHLVTKTYESPELIADSATFFFVNNKGDAVTTRRVAQELITRQNVEKNYLAFKERVSGVGDIKGKRAAIKQLEKEAGYGPGVATHAKTRFLDCFERVSSITFHLHPTLDLAILQFEWEGELRYSGHAVFAEDRAYTAPGDFLCRLGFPFSEFSDFEYLEESDELVWKQGAGVAAPRFPIDGMVTRFLGNADGVYGIEMSTPGFKGHNGAPLFDEDGIVCGMQFAVNHLYLGSEIEDYHLFDRGRERQVSSVPFMHVGQCIDAEAIKAFLTEHRVEHYIDE